MPHTRRSAAGASGVGAVRRRAPFQPGTDRLGPSRPEPRLGTRAARVAGLPRRAPGRAAASWPQATPRSRAAACASTCTSTGRKRRAHRQTRFPARPTGWRQRSDLDLRRPGCVDGARHSLMLGGLPRAVKAGPMDWGRRVKRRSSWPDLAR
jgi:hypothetical protein